MKAFDVIEQRQNDEKRPYVKEQQIVIERKEKFQFQIQNKIQIKGIATELRKPKVHLIKPKQIPVHVIKPRQNSKMFINWSMEGFPANPNLNPDQHSMGNQNLTGSPTNMSGSRNFLSNMIPEHPGGGFFDIFKNNHTLMTQHIERQKFDTHNDVRNNSKSNNQPHRGQNKNYIERQLNMHQSTVQRVQIKDSQPQSEGVSNKFWGFFNSFKNKFGQNDSSEKMQQIDHQPNSKQQIMKKQPNRQHDRSEVGHYQPPSENTRKIFFSQSVVVSEYIQPHDNTAK